jgi:VWFA-related protein
MSVVKPFVFVVAALGIAAAASAQENPIIVHASESHAVYASVLNKEGAPVTSLQAADFVVREGGVEREVVRASTASEPMRIAVLVDTSRAMEPYIADVRRGLRSFFREMQGQDQIALFEFGDRATRLVDYTSDPARLEAGIGRIFSRSHSGAYALDAITDAARDFRARESARSVIVVITAQGPEFSNRYHQKVLDDVKAANATLHSLVLTRNRVPVFNSGIREREITLSNGADLTGGRREDLLTSMALEERLADLARELKSQYQIVYARPDTLIPPDKIEVAVRQPRLMVRAPRVPLSPRAHR